MCPDGAKGTEPRTLRLCTECQQGVIDRPEWQVPLQHGAGCSRRAMNVVKVRVVEQQAPERWGDFDDELQSLKDNGLVEQQPPTEERCKDCGEPVEVVGHGKLGGDLYRCGCTASPTEGRATFAKPPRDWWREVPCGHPQDPVAWWGEHGLFCHCGWGLDVDAALPEVPQGAPGPIVPCGKCGCFPAIPPAPEQTAVSGPRQMDVERGAAALATARGVRGLFDSDAQRELAALTVLESLLPEAPGFDQATVDAVVRELESEDDVTLNVKLTSGPKFRAGWDAAVAHIRERFKGAARDTGGRDS